MLIENKRKLTHSSILRLAVSYLAVFILSSLVLVAFIYWSSIDYIYKQLDHHIIYDKENLSNIYQQQGQEKLIQSINERLLLNSYESVYLLYDLNSQKKLAGNLSAMVNPLEDGWHIVALDKLSKTLHHKTHSARILKTQVNSNLVLVNGLDMESAHQQEHTIINNLIIGIVIVFILGAIGGLITSINTIRKVTLINETFQKVGDGELTKRIPVDGSDDEFDLLANNFNHMLGRIQALMDRVQNISNSIAHDLRTPLTRIRSRLEAIQETCDNQDADEIEITIEETDNLLATFETLLNINKFESGIQKMNLQLISSLKLISDVIDYNEPLAWDKSVKIQFNDELNCFFEADQNMLFLALTNIINNAIKYTPDNGEVVIQTELIKSSDDNPELLQISIRDNGVGISDSEKDKVFELFYRCEKSRDNQGNGLGLNLVAAIVKLHKGEIKLYDNNPGLNVELSLPIQK